MQILSSCEPSFLTNANKLLTMTRKPVEIKYDLPSKLKAGGKQKLHTPKVVFLRLLANKAKMADSVE